MPATASQDDEDLATLESIVKSLQTLIIELQSAIKEVPLADTTTTEQELSSTAEKATKQRNSVDALSLAHDAAALIRAHSTKLSLLIINKPFTPTAISKVLAELTAGPVTALAASVELCEATHYTKIMRSELQWRVQKVYLELSALLKDIPLDGQVLSADQKNGSGTIASRGSLASTGVLWEACDSLLELNLLGIAGLVIKKAEQYRDTLKDALEELQEWGEEESDDEDDGEETVAHEADLGEVGSTVRSAQAELDDLLSSQQHLPPATNDPLKFRDRHGSSVRRLKLIVLMYTAVIKRRFKTVPVLPHPELPPELKTQLDEDPGIILTLDEVMNVLKKIPDVADELANAFYWLETKEVDSRMDDCFFKAFAAAELLVVNWEGEKDDFSTWLHKFQVAMKKGW